MSSVYSGARAWVASVTVLDDGDNAEAASIAPGIEAVADQASCLVSDDFVPLGSIPFASSASRFALDFNYLNVVTATAAGDEYRAAIKLVNGATVASIDVFFIPKTTARGGWPLGSAPVVSLLRHAITAGGTMGAPSTVATATYVPVSQLDYQNGQNKVMTVSPAHVVDADGYIYMLSVTDEAGANAIPGGAYLAYRVNYS